MTTPRCKNPGTNGTITTQIICQGYDITVTTEITKEDGSKETVTEQKHIDCDGDAFKNAAHTYTIKRDVSAAYHKPVKEEDVKSTCVEHGHTNVIRCSECDALLSSTELDLAEHIYDKTSETVERALFSVRCDSPADKEGLALVTKKCSVCKKYTPVCHICEYLELELKDADAGLESARKELSDATAEAEKAKKALTEAEQALATAKTALEEAEKAVKEADEALKNLDANATAEEKDAAAKKLTAAERAKAQAEITLAEREAEAKTAEEASKKADEAKKDAQDIVDNDKNLPAAQDALRAHLADGGQHYECAKCSELVKEIGTAKTEAEKTAAKDAYTDHQTNDTDNHKLTDITDAISVKKLAVPQHEWGDDEIPEVDENGNPITIPPCGSGGFVVIKPTHTCKICNTQEETGETKILDAKDEHEPDQDPIITKEPTCTEPGEKEYPAGTKCKICDEPISGKFEVEALGHDMVDDGKGESIVSKEPTCDAPGERLVVTEGKRCQREGCDYVEPGTKTTEVILPLGHKWGDPVPVNEGKDDVPPTCGGTGKAFVTVTCSVCGKEEKQTIEIAPTGQHTWGDWTITKQPTYTEPGSQERTCSVCGKKDVREIPILGECEEHDYGEWEIIKQPTATEDGSRRRVCKICGHEDVERIPATGEEPVDPSTKDFTIECIQPVNGYIYAPATAKRGTTVTVTFSPNSGYELDQVQITQTGGGYITATGSGSRRAFTMPAANVEVRAVFSKIADSSTNWSSTSTGAVSRWTDPSQTAIQDVPHAGSAGQLFYDVPAGHWASGEIAWASQMGYMAGDRLGAFNPDGAISHQQMWTVLARISGYWPSDMADARRWAVDNGYAEGANPTVSVTRSQMVTALYRSARLMGNMNNALASLTGFTDSRTIPSAARNPMAWAVANGIISGTSNGRLNPNATVTRAQFAVFLYRFNYRA